MAYYNLADLHRLRDENPAMDAYLKKAEFLKRKKKISKKIINDFDDFSDSDKTLLRAIDSEFKLISSGCTTHVQGSRIKGNWHEDHEEFGTSDWDIIIKNISHSDRKLIRRTILPKLEAKFKIKIDKNLLGFSGRSVEVK